MWRFVIALIVAGVLAGTMFGQDGRSQPGTVLPIASYHFKVEFKEGDKKLTATFQEISGLNMGSEPIEDRNWTSLSKTSKLVMRKGLFEGSRGLDSFFPDEYRQEHLWLATGRSTVVIVLVDEHGDPLFTWKLENVSIKGIRGKEGELPAIEVVGTKVEI